MKAIAGYAIGILVGIYILICFLVPQLMFASVLAILLGGCGYLFKERLTTGRWM